MSIPTLAADLAARIPELSKDCVINNSLVIQDLIEKEFEDRDRILLFAWQQKVRAIMEVLIRINRYSSVANDQKSFDFETFQMLEANLAQIYKLSSRLLEGYKSESR